MPESAISKIMMILAVVNGLWAVMSMNRKTLTVLPELREHASLVTSGPYKYIRHPMYTSVLMLLTGMLLNEFNFIRLTVLIVVLIVLILKLRLEEKQLQNRFPGYKQYMLKTKRLVPFVY